MTNFEIDSNSPVPKYYQVYTALLKSIEDGEFTVGSALPFTHELIANFGVSRITITKVMDMLESDGVIERQQGKGIFVRDKLAATAQTPGMIAIVNDLRHGPRRYERQYLWSSIVHGLEQSVATHNMRLQLIGATELDDNKFHFEQLGGMILHPGSAVNQQRLQLMETLISGKFPIILVDRYYRALNCDRVLFNDEEVGYLLTESLIKKGHRRIAFALSSEPGVTSVEDRLKGYQRALADHAITYDNELVLNIYSYPFIHDSIDLEPMNTHFELHAKIEQYGITAVFTANDLTTERLVFDQMRLNHDALRRYDVLSETDIKHEQSGLSVSLEIAMIGEAISPHYRNYISIAAHQSGQQLGAAAADLLIGRMNGTVTGPPKTKIVPMKILHFTP